MADNRWGHGQIWWDKVWGSRARRLGRSVTEKLTGPDSLVLFAARAVTRRKRVCTMCITTVCPWPLAVSSKISALLATAFASTVSFRSILDTDRTGVHRDRYARPGAFDSKWEIRSLRRAMRVRTPRSRFLCVSFLFCVYVSIPTPPLWIFVFARSNDEVSLFAKAKSAFHSPGMLTGFDVLTPVRRCIIFALAFCLPFFRFPRREGEGFIAERLACRVSDRLTILFPLLSIVTRRQHSHYAAMKRRERSLSFDKWKVNEPGWCDHGHVVYREVNCASNFPFVTFVRSLFYLPISYFTHRRHIPKFEVIVCGVMLI